MFETGRFPFPPRGVLAGVARVRGSDDYPAIIGEVRIYYARTGSVLEADIHGLPAYGSAHEGRQPVGPFGFHIHMHSGCEPHGGADAFGEAGGHYNLANTPHGSHAGDLPSLIPGHDGRAQMSVLLDAFRPQDVLGRAVMIHENPDDYRTQPAGNSGKRIACGVILEI